MSQVDKTSLAQAKMVARDEYHVGHVLHADQTLGLTLLSGRQIRVEPPKPKS